MNKDIFKRFPELIPLETPLIEVPFGGVIDVDNGTPASELLITLPKGIPASELFASLPECSICKSKLRTDEERQTELCADCFEEEKEGYLKSETD